MGMILLGPTDTSQKWLQKYLKRKVNFDIRFPTERAKELHANHPELSIRDLVSRMKLNWELTDHCFATTAHAAQGQTYKEGVVMDMHIGEAGDPLTAYIALTRVPDRHRLFVYRPFDASPFQKGAKVGRDVLLRWWSGEKLDWAALRAKYRDERERAECHERKPTAAFTAGRWKRTDAARVCKECIKRHVERNAPWQSMACNAWKEEKAFPDEYTRPQCTFYRICSTCESTKLCSQCGLRKARDGFSSGAWRRTRQGRRLCLACACKADGFWTCTNCQKRKRSTAFQVWTMKRSQERRKHGRQICDQCWSPRLARSVVRKAQARVRATRRKLATQKRDKVVAEVMALIAQKRQEGGVRIDRAPGSARRPDTAERASTGCLFCVCVI